MLLPGFALGYIAIPSLAIVAGAAVRTEAVDAGLDESRTCSFARAGNCLLCRLIHIEHVRAVDAHRTHAVRFSPARELTRRLTNREWRLHGVKVVLAEKNNR